MLLPEPPLDSAIDPSLQTAVTIVMAVLAAGALLFALVFWRRTGRATVLLLFCAGGAMMLFEPMVDTVGGVWFPREESWVAFTLYGRPIPVWLCFTYFAYFGILVALVFLALERGVSIWPLFFACALADVVLEVTLLNLDTYIYYGDQPLVVAKFPLWWAAVNAAIVVTAARLVQARGGPVVPVALSSSAAVNAVAGWPSWLAINSDLGWLPTQLCGVVTWALALWLVSILAREPLESARVNSVISWASDRGAGRAGA